MPDQEIVIIIQRLDKIERVINHILRTIEQHPEMVSIFNSVES